MEVQGRMLEARCLLAATDLSQPSRPMRFVERRFESRTTVGGSRRYWANCWVSQSGVAAEATETAHSARDSSGGTMAVLLPHQQRPRTARKGPCAVPMACIARVISVRLVYVPDDRPWPGASKPMTLQPLPTRGPTKAASCAVRPFHPFTRSTLWPFPSLVGSHLARNSHRDSESWVALAKQIGRSSAEA